MLTMFLKVVFLFSLPRDEVSHFFARFPHMRVVVLFSKEPLHTYAQ